MIKLILCEWKNEFEIVKLLLENNRLIFGKDDLLDLQAFHLRQLNRYINITDEN